MLAGIKERKAVNSINNLNGTNKRSRLIMVLIVAALILLIATTSAEAAMNLKIADEPACQRITVEIDGQAVTFDNPGAYINQQGRTMVPVRFVSEYLSYRVEWRPDLGDRGGIEISRARENDERDSEKKGALESPIESNEEKSSENSKIIAFFLGRTQYKINGESHHMDTAPIISEERTMLPVKYVGDALGLEVQWCPETYTVLLLTPDKSSSEEEGFEAERYMIGRDEEVKFMYDRETHILELDWGRKNTGGYQVTIEKFERENGALRVDYKLVSPGSAPVPMVITYPSDERVVPEEKRNFDCITLNLIEHSKLDV